MIGASRSSRGLGGEPVPWARSGRCIAAIRMATSLRSRHIRATDGRIAAHKIRHHRVARVSGLHSAGELADPACWNGLRAGRSVFGAGGARFDGAVRRVDRRRGIGVARCRAALPRPDVWPAGDRRGLSLVCVRRDADAGGGFRYRLRVERVGGLRGLYAIAATAIDGGRGGVLTGRPGGRLHRVPVPGVRQSRVSPRPDSRQGMGRADRDPTGATAAPGCSDAGLMAAGLMAVSLADFDFTLSPDRIAQSPARPRDAARLLCVRDGAMRDHIVRELPDLLRPGDLLVANDTRVIPAQLTGFRGKARIGITLDQPRADGTWHALARNARRLRVGDELRFEDDGELAATVTARDPDGGVTLRFNQAVEAFVSALRRGGGPGAPPPLFPPPGPRAPGRPRL